MAEKITLVGCGIFKEEVEACLAGLGQEGLDIYWQDVGLHDDIGKMEGVLTRETARARAAGAGRVGLLFGQRCLPTMAGFAQAHGVTALPVANCLAALGGGDDKLRELEKDRTLVGTTGWVRKMWLGRRGTALGWNEDDYRMNFGRYDRILVLESPLAPLTEEEIITCFDLVQVPIETQPVTLGYFRETLKKFLAKTAGV